MSCLEIRRIDLGDAAVDHGLGIGRDGHLAGHHLVDELGDHILGDGALLGITSHAAFGDDLVEEAGFLGLRRGWRRAGLSARRNSCRSLLALGGAGAASALSFLRASVLLITSCSSASSLSLPSIFVSRFESRPRASTSFRSGSTWLATCSGLKSSMLVEVELDIDLRAIFLERVVDLEGQARLQAREHLVEVVGIDVDELTILEPGQGLGRHSGQVGQNAYHEG